MQIRKIYDLSAVLNDHTPVWPGDNHFHFEPRVAIKDGAICNSSSFSCTVHLATHADAPRHYVDQGKDLASVDVLRFIGPAKVRQVLTEDWMITAKDLQKLDIEEGDRLLLKTGNKGFMKDGVFHREFYCFDLCGAEYLVKKKIRCIGIDYVSVEKFETENGEVHRALLENEMGILEGLDLDMVPEGDYFLSALPLKMEGSDGSPVRAVLLEID